jgi:hypothetical protein
MGNAYNCLSVTFSQRRGRAPGDQETSFLIEFKPSTVVLVE